MSELRQSEHALMDLAVRALVRHRTEEENARAVAEALVAAQRDGQAGHGLSRLASYCAQAESGKVDGFARPQVTVAAPAAVRVDAANGFAYPALRLAIEEVAARARTSGIAAAAIHRSHHFGVAGYHAERLAERGLVALVFGNSPKAIAPWGGRAAVFGTNPIAFAAPRQEEPPLVIDLSLSKVARGKIMVAAKEGRAIPEGWALDAEGRPTTDAAAALEGTMLPMGDAKGAALVLMVEALAAALTGANFGFEASSFFTADGPPPGVGQFLIGVAPAAFCARSFDERLETLLGAVLDQEGTRIPGSRRLEARARARSEGIPIPEGLFQEIRDLAG